MTLIAAEQTKFAVFLRERKQGRLMEGADIFSFAEIILSFVRKQASAQKLALPFWKNEVGGSERAPLFPKHSRGLGHWLWACARHHHRVRNCVRIPTNGRAWAVIRQ
jgi:hypothetical protein